MLTLDLLRHGALQGGIKYRGHTDDPLTPQGRLQMNRVWDSIADDVDIIITSPLSRCALPAADWAARSHIPCIIDPRVAELHYGDWEGKTAIEIEAAYPGMLAQWRRDPTGMCPPGGESPEALRIRLQAWLTDVISTYPDKHILLVSHSGTQRMLISIAMQAPIASSRNLSMPYACWSRVICSADNQQLVFHQRCSD